ncbi:MAG: IMP dehydrogenase, partial [Pseudomonadota bacterium]|nr:IMP dehydrogenase [Pseudomonadota bacterium]
MRIIEEALTFDDVLLVPGHSLVLPKEVDLRTRLTREITLNIPLLSAAMDTVTEAKLAIAIAQEGGMGILHKSMSIEQQALEVRRVKKFESGIVKDPVTVKPNTTVKELLELIQAYHISGMPVVEGENLVGIITNRDLRFVTDFSQPVSNLMTHKDLLVTVQEGASRAEIIDKLQHHRIEKMLLVNEKFHLRGMVTVKDIMKAKEKPLACKDSSGRLRVGAAV